MHVRRRETEQCIIYGCNHFNKIATDIIWGAYHNCNVWAAICNDSRICMPNCKVIFRIYLHSGYEAYKLLWLPTRNLICFNCVLSMRRSYYNFVMEVLVLVLAARVLDRICLLWAPSQCKRATMLYFANVFIYLFIYLFFYGRLILRPWWTEVRKSFTRGGPWVSLEKLLLGFFPGHP